MRKPFFSVVNNKADNVGKIMIYGIIGPDYWNDGVQARNFVDTLNYLARQYDRIDVHINSPGGSIWEGLAIFNAIRACQKEVHTYNDGICFSMAMIILLAGHKVHVAKGSMGMLHNAGGKADGNAADMREAAEILDKHDLVLAELIAERTGKTIDEVKAEWLDYKDHFFTAQELVDAGMAHQIDEYPLADIPNDPQNLTTHQIAAFYQERMEEPSASMLDKIQKHVSNLLNPQNMKFTKVLNLKGVNNASQSQLDEANADLTEAGITGYGIYPESIINDAANATNKVTTLTNDLATMTTRATTAENALATATTNAATAATEASNKIKDLEAKVEAFGKNPGAKHKNNPDGDDVTVDEDEADIQARIDAMPHNRAADELYGKPKAAK